VGATAGPTGDRGGGTAPTPIKPEADREGKKAHRVSGGPSVVGRRVQRA